ncbi:hypothetical protein SBA4_3770005 [Candidatus Sulfopaludibacter sp. SbA4]|nr:hypothetical protein SBA4_3770005 [Candidatus Sulfopaludibacter sp. SbA4]
MRLVSHCQPAPAFFFFPVQLGKKIYVLHAFEKKSRKGIETPKQDVDLIRKRYQEAKDLANNEEGQTSI